MAATKSELPPPLPRARDAHGRTTSTNTANTTRKKVAGKASSTESASGKSASGAKADLKATDISLKGLLGAQPRQTLPSNANILGALNWGYLPRRQYAALVDLSTLPDNSMSPQQLMELLADASPEVGMATWNMTRLGKSEWTYEVRSPNSTAGDAKGKALLDALIARLNPLSGGFNGLLSQWMQSAVLEGAVCGECIPSADFTDVEDFAPVQPWTIFFRRDENQALVPLQWQPMLASGAVPDTISGPPSSAAMLIAQSTTYDRFDGFRVLNTETFSYVAMDPFIDDPYGRLPFASVVQQMAFLAQLYKDLRQWSHTHAWGRLDVSVLAERVEAAIPPRIKMNPAERLQFRQQYIDAIKTAYQALNPDDTFVHYDDVTVSGVAEQQGQTFQIDSLMRVVERAYFRALRQLPILMGSNEGTTETWGTLQMEVYALGIASIQEVVAGLVTKLLTAALRLYGSTSIVEFSFAKMRSTDRIKDETARKISIQNESAIRDEGWQTQDEASINITGSKSVAPAPDPDNPYLPGQPDAANTTTPATPSAPDNDTPAADKPPAEAKEGAKDDGKSDKQPAGKSETTTKSIGAAIVAAAAAAADAHDWTGVYGRALSRLLAAAAADPLGHRAATRYERPAAQRELAESLVSALRGYFTDLTVSESTLRYVVNLHSREAVANAHQTPPLVARAVRAIIDRRDDETAEMTPDERAALIASIAATLAMEVQDADPDLTSILTNAWEATWAAGARQALTSIGVATKTAATFTLTNMGVLGRIANLVRQRVAQLQQVTRQRLATVIADDLARGQPLGAIVADVRGALDRMATGGPAGGDTTAAASSAAESEITSRAETIGNAETSAAWNDGMLQTGARNGVQQKAWVTNGNPDPHSNFKPCADNEEAGAIAIDDSFPSGADAPPEHGNCECGLELVAPDELPSDDQLWLGA